MYLMLRNAGDILQAIFRGVGSVGELFRVVSNAITNW